MRPSKTQTSLLSNRERLETLGLATIGIILAKQRTTQLLIRLCACTVWTEPLLFTYDINRFSHYVTHLIPNMVTFKTFNPKWHFRGWVQDRRSLCYFSTFMICHFSVSSFTLEQNSDSLQVHIYLTRKHFRITYTTVC